MSALCCPISAVSACFYTTGRLIAARCFSTVGVGVILPFLLLMALFSLRLGQMLPVFRRWCRRYAAHFTAVGAAVYTTARVNAALFFGRCCKPVSYTHLRAHETDSYLVCRLLLEKKRALFALPVV